MLEGGLHILLGNFAQSKVLLRSEDPEICLELKPEAQELYTGWRARVAPSHMLINSYGIRGPELNISGHEEKLRVIILGDSFTFGQGVDYAESYPARVGAELSKLGIDAEVLNFGVPGHSTPQSLAFARAKAAPLKPDVVLLSVFANDLSPAESYCVYGRGGSALTAWLLRNCYSFRLGYFLASPLIFGQVDPSDYAELGTPESRFRRAISDLEELGREQDFLVGVVLLTDREMFLEDRYCPGCTPAHDLLEGSQVKRFDLGGTWRDMQEDIPRFFIIGDDHLGSEGNRLVGRTLAEQLSSWQALRDRVAQTNQP